MTEHANSIFAIGHSTRPIEQFIALLAAHDIHTLADIRTVPKSRHNPQFSQDALAVELPAAGVRYVQLRGLGGLRRPMPNSPNGGWENSSFRGYADYMQTPEFEAALEELIRLSGEGNVAMMCAEGNPFRCHRRLVADALVARGIPVYHILSRKTARPHVLTPFAHVQDGRVTYPPLPEQGANLSDEKSV